MYKIQRKELTCPN